MMKKLLSRDNLLAALHRVEKNKGKHGVDGMPVKFLRAHLLQNWDELRNSIEDGTYEPMPVRRVEIPKPNGGVRLLGIPTVTDHGNESFLGSVSLYTIPQRFVSQKKA